MPQGGNASIRTAENVKRLWFHAVSVGEFNAIKALIDTLSSHFSIVISTTTQTGQTLAKQTFPDLACVYFPFDFRWAISRAYRGIKPDMILIAETELWPNAMAYFQKQRCPVMLINGRLSKRSFSKYKKICWLIGPCLNRFTNLLVQSDADAERFKDLGTSPEKMAIMGNLKFETATRVDVAKKKQLEEWFNFSSQSTLLTIASTHQGEDADFLACYKSLKTQYPDLVLLYAPRHPERLPQIETILKRCNLAYTLRSQLTDQKKNTADIVVVDTIGELVTIYSLSHLAVIGGSFSTRGGQNPLEPMPFDVPVVVGPNMQNFSSILPVILEENAIIQVSGFAMLQETLSKGLANLKALQPMTVRAKRLLEKNRGAKQFVLNAVYQHFKFDNAKFDNVETGL